MIIQRNHTIGISIFRIIICFIIIKNICFYFPMADDLFGANGIFPYDLYIKLMKENNIGYLTYPFNIPFASQAFLLLIILFAGLYMLGYGGKLTGIALVLTTIILKFRNGFILDGSDNVIQVLLPFLVLIDNHTYFKHHNKNIPNNNLWWHKLQDIALLGFMIQVCYVYFFSALEKLQGQLWMNGTAIFYTMRVKEFMATKWNITLTKNLYFVVFTTYFTLIWELMFSFLIWFRKTKFWIILGGVILHFGIWIFMRIDNFSWVMIATYFVFITNKEYVIIKNRFLQKRFTIYIDGWCPKCRKFGKLVSKFNTFSSINILNLREDLSENSSIDIARAKNEMAGVYENSTKVKYGFSALLTVCYHIPLFWLFVPFMQLLKIFRIGNIFYNEFAIKRKIIPIHCDSESCKL